MLSRIFLLYAQYLFNILFCINYNREQRFQSSTLCSRIFLQRLLPKHFDGSSSLEVVLCMSAIGSFSSMWFFYLLRHFRQTLSLSDMSTHYTVWWITCSFCCSQSSLSVYWPATVTLNTVWVKLKCLCINPFY